MHLAAEDGDHWDSGFHGDWDTYIDILRDGTTTNPVPAICFIAR